MNLLTSRDGATTLEETRGAGRDEWGSVYNDYIGTGQPSVALWSHLAVRLWEETIRSRSVRLWSPSWPTLLATCWFGSTGVDSVALTHDLIESGSHSLRFCWISTTGDVPSESGSSLTERALDAVTEIRDVFQLSAEEACRVGGFSRRNLSHWAADRTPHHSTVRHLLEAEVFARAGSGTLGREPFRTWVVRHLPDNRDLVSVLADSQALRDLVRLFADEHAALASTPRRLSADLELEADEDRSNVDRAHTPRDPSELRHPRGVR